MHQGASQLPRNAPNARRWNHVIALPSSPYAHWTLLFSQPAAPAVTRRDRLISSVRGMPTSKRPARTGKKLAEQTVRTVWYTIRRILDERRVSNRIQYLVDWDDDPVTGAPYEPTWVWSCDVTELAKREWKKRKASVDSKPPPVAKSQPPASPASDEDQSPRPANFRQLQRTSSGKRHRSSSSSPSIEAGPAKKRPRYSPSLSAEPVPSIVSAPSPTPASELPEFDAPTEFVVGISKAPNFDPAEFFSVAGSQSTSYPSQSLTELEEQDQRLVLSSQISLRTVPDSQDFSGQSLSTASHRAAHESAVESQEGSSSEVIPDSLERRGNCTAAIPVSSHSAERIPESSIPAGPNTNFAIPSHQRDTKELSLSNLLNSNSSESDSNRIFNTPQKAAADNSRRDSSPGPTAFLSQIEIASPPEAVSSPPVSKQISEPSSQVVAVPPQQADLRPSQDAQVVRNFFDIVLDKVSDSNETDTTSTRDHSNDLDKYTSQDISNHSYPELTQDHNMDDSAGNNAATQRSAVDELNELFTLNPTTAGQDPPNDETSQGVVAESGSYGHVDAHSETRSHSPLASDPDQSQWQPITQSVAPETLEQSDLTTASSLVAFNTQPEADSQILVPMLTHEEQSGTVSPGAVLQSADPVLDPLGVAPSAVFTSSVEPIPLGQQSPDSPSSSVTSDDPILMQHTITLPFQTSLRPQYDNILLAHRKQVKEFSEAFSNEVYTEPSLTLVTKIDDLFVALRNLCDYPQDLVGTTLEKLSPKQQVKYACDANPKFCFVFELLQGIETNIRVLIVAQSVELLQLLAYVAVTLEIDYVAKSLEDVNTDLHGSACSVTLALPGEEFDIDEFEVVIGFDHAFGSSPVARALSPEGQAVRPPMVLTLVTTHSIEHIDQHLPEDSSPLERKNCLLAGIVNARKLTSDPDRGYPEPHEIASMFCDFLNGAVEGVLWQPVPLPDDVLDIYMSSQSQSQSRPQVAVLADPENGRKRKLDDNSEEDAKRIRTIPKESTTRKEAVPLPDDVGWLLDSVSAASQSAPGLGVSVPVPLSVLQALAEQKSELERRAMANNMEEQYKGVIEILEARVKDYERTSSKTYQAYRVAVEDRTKFEAEKRKAETALQSAQETAQRGSVKLQAKIGELEATIARLTSNGESDGETPLAASERLVQEVQLRIKQLEKRLENATQDGEYAKNAYQEASNAATALQSENRELKEQNEKLQKRASENVTRVHEIQNQSMAKTYLKQIEELKVLQREREIELDRAREELRQLRNSRRETRQSSVPRSPRMGLLSPRTGRPYAGPASRGTSPTGATESPMIGAVPLPGNGNGRWNHLRE